MEQEALLESYRSAREIRLARRRYCQQVAAAYKECDEAGEAVFGETDDEEEDIVEAVPRHHDHEANTSTGTAGSEEE